MPNPRVNIWTKRDLATGTNAKLVWSGEMVCIPRVGEWITIYDGWGAEEVESVSYELYDNSVVIKLDTADYGNEYPVVDRQGGPHAMP